MPNFRLKASTGSRESDKEVETGSSVKESLLYEPVETKTGSYLDLVRIESVRKGDNNNNNNYKNNSFISIIIMITSTSVDPPIFGLVLQRF